MCYVLERPRIYLGKWMHVQKLQNIKQILQIQSFIMLIPWFAKVILGPYVALWL